LAGTPINGDHNLNGRWATHTEYQRRRVGLIGGWQQSLARLGMVRTLNKNVKLGGGYTYFVTFPFGRYPQANNLELNGTSAPGSRADFGQAGI